MIIRCAAASSSISRRFQLWAAALLALAATPAPAAPLIVERTFILMRHGVRPPTKDPAMPVGFAAEPWPGWGVKPGYLTERGAIAIRLLGGWDRSTLIKAGLLPAKGCPTPGALSLYSDSDQRTIATGDAWAAGIAPGCRIANAHQPQDVPDRLFAAAGENGEPFDPRRADAAVAEGLGSGGIAAAERALADPLARVDRILCGSKTESCGIRAAPSTIISASAHERPKLGGALDRGSTAAQIMLLEFADGKPLGEVGWGRASAADISAMSALHAAEFKIIARPHYIAARNVAPITRRMLNALTAGQAPRVTMIVGHDTNVASLGGLLGLHWQAPGFAADDPTPGGAIILERMRDRAGRRYVRARYHSQTLAQIRGLIPLGPKGGNPYDAALPIAGCGQICPLARFVALTRSALE